MNAFDSFRAAAEALGVFAPEERVQLVFEGRHGSVVTWGSDGVVKFVDGEWVYWKDAEGRMHATRKDCLRKGGRR